MPKPKNNGQVLMVRISTEAHAAIAAIQSGYIEHVEMRAGAVTKGFVVEEAVKALQDRVSKLVEMKLGIPPAPEWPVNRMEEEIMKLKLDGAVPEGGEVM